MRDEDDPAFTALPRDAFTQADADRLPGGEAPMDEARKVARGQPASAIVRRAKAAAGARRVYLCSEAVEAIERTPTQLGAALDGGLLELLIERFATKKLQSLAGSAERRPGWLHALNDLIMLVRALLRSASPRADKAVTLLKQAMPRVIGRMAKDRLAFDSDEGGTTVMLQTLDLIRACEEAIFRPRGECVELGTNSADLVDRCALRRLPRCRSSPNATAGRPTWRPSAGRRSWS